VIVEPGTRNPAPRNAEPRSRLRLSAALTLALGLFIFPAAYPLALPIETLRSVGALPAHVAGTFREIAACHLTPEGDLLVFDRTAHAVWLVPRSGPPREIIQIGVEPGKLLRPMAFDSWSDGTFVIADAPFRSERIQAFFYAGGSMGGFTLPGRSTPRIAVGDLVLSGVGSLEYTGRTVLVSEPDSGALLTEYSLDGRSLRSFGALRATGLEAEPELHAALNAGLPLALSDKTGYYFVFLGGVPAFRKYAADGTFLFERHVEGIELDRHIQNLPKAWAKRRTADGEFPIVPPTVRTAALDREGNLWLALVTGHTYVYDASGDKRRTIQFRAAGPFSPSNLYFTPAGRILAAPGCYTFDPTVPERK
jgi:hypothetical protein